MEVLYYQEVAAAKSKARLEPMVLPEVRQQVPEEEQAETTKKLGQPAQQAS